MMEEYVENAKIYEGKLKEAKARNLAAEKLRKMLGEAYSLAEDECVIARKAVSEARKDVTFCNDLIAMHHGKRRQMKVL